MDIPWNVPLSHETVGLDGQFTAFLDGSHLNLLGNSQFPPGLCTSSDSIFTA